MQYQSFITATNDSAKIFVRGNILLAGKFNSALNKKKGTEQNKARSRAILARLFLYTDELEVKDAFNYFHRR